MEIKELDYVLVPIGLSVMIIYHLWLLYMILTQPTKTVIGISSFSRRIWIRTMMQDPASNGSLPVQTLSNYMTASTVMATTAIVLGSLITALMNNVFLEHKKNIIGNTTEECQFVKLIMTIVCFLLAFLFGFLSLWDYSHTIMPINIPTTANNKAAAMSYVARVLDRGGMFWSMGLRAYYFSFPLSLWAFGPIPMIAGCFALVGMLYFLDMQYDCSDMDFALSDMESVKY